MAFGKRKVASRLYDIDVIGYDNGVNKLRLFDIETIDETDQELRRNIINLLLALNPFRCCHQLLGKLQDAVIQLFVAAGRNGFTVSALCLAFQFLRL